MGLVLVRVLCVVFILWICVVMMFCGVFGNVFRYFSCCSIMFRFRCFGVVSRMILVRCLLCCVICGVISVLRLWLIMNMCWWLMCGCWWSRVSVVSVLLVILLLIVSEVVVSCLL